MEDDDDDDYRPPATPPTNSNRLVIKISALRKRAAAAGAGAGGGGGAGGGVGPPAHLWTENCPRRGDLKRTGSDSDIGHMPCGEVGCENCEGGEEDVNGDKVNNKQSGPRKRRKTTKVGWRTEEGGPVVTKVAGELLAGLLGIYGRANRGALDAVLNDPSSSTLLSSSSTLLLSRCDDIKVLVAKIDRHVKRMHSSELEFMLLLVQLALNVDRYVFFFNRVTSYP